MTPPEDYQTQREVDTLQAFYSMIKYQELFWNKAVISIRRSL